MVILLFDCLALLNQRWKVPKQTAIDAEDTANQLRLLFEWDGQPCRPYARIIFSVRLP